MDEKRLRKLAGLNERIGSNPLEVRDDITERIEKLFRQMEDMVLGPAIDTFNKPFDKPGVKKALGLFKKIDSNLTKVEKEVEILDNLGL